MQSERPERSGADRRRQPRGGRRPGDADGFAPLVMVVGDQAETGTLVEAVLVRLKFAVTPIATVGEALTVIPALRPDIIVASSADAARIRLESPEHTAVVVLTAAMRDNPDELPDQIRQAIRGNRAE